MVADLHCHSTCSDGGMTPAELFLLAKQKQLTALAITDHDHFTQTPKRTAEAAAAGVRLLPAVELSTKDLQRNRKVHLLCYCPKDRKAMDAHCQEMSDKRRVYGEEMIGLVQKKYDIPHEAIAKYERQSSTIFKQHIMHALMDYGYTQQLYGALFSELFGEQGVARVAFVYPDVFTMARFAKECGAVVVLAHPYEYDSLDVMEQLVQAQLIDGIEAKHSRCTAEGKQHLLQYAGEKGLMVTGGSDFHGFYSSRPVMLGDCTTTERELTVLLDCAAKK